MSVWRPKTLSASVTDAIDFMNIVQKHPNFKGSEATVTFIRTIDRLFDLLTSRNHHGKAFKKPLTLSDMSGLESTAKYLLNLTSSEGEPIIKHPPKTFVLGFVITIKSTLEMAKQMLTLSESPFSYVLTYKYSQDHIEILFSCFGQEEVGTITPTVSSSSMHSEECFLEIRSQLL